MRIEGPSPAPDRAEVREARAAAQAFEALVIRELLKSARAGSLADSPLVGKGEWQDLAERHWADAIASGAPLGLARLLEAAIARETRS